MRGKRNRLTFALFGILVVMLITAGFPLGASAGAAPALPAPGAATYGAWPPRPCVRAVYLVRPGDNLFRIGLRFGVNYLVLAQFNRLRNPNLIFFGMPLFIPCKNFYPPSASPYPPGRPPVQPPKPVPAPGGQSNVAIMDFQFAPATINVRVGQTVMWRNNGPSPHTSTSDSGLWDSGTLNPGRSFSRTFTTAGMFTYHCEIHPSMRGTVVVMP